MGLYMLILATADVIYKKEYYKYSHLWVHSSLCRFSGLLCKAASFSFFICRLCIPLNFAVAVVSSEVSTLLLVFMAIERYARLVWKPFGRSGTTLRTTVVWISGCWILGMLPKRQCLLRHWHRRKFLQGAFACDSTSTVLLKVPAFDRFSSKLG